MRCLTPPAALVNAVKRLFRTDIQFVGDVGPLHPKLQFNGVYFGGNTPFIHGHSDRAYGFVIGHEFLHHLRQSGPELYERFTPAAARLLKQKRGASMPARKHAEYSEGVPEDRGWEELFADTFVDAWADSAFLASVRPPIVLAVMRDEACCQQQCSCATLAPEESR